MENYTVMKQVGRGAFGTAQLVRDKRDGLRYILKKTRLARQPERQREATIMEMFIQRATAHRNVVRCKESWMEKGFVACLVLEYCGGGELADVLNNRLKRELFDEEALLGWAAQLASALAYLHANAIVHRDVKAANIFIRDDKSLALGDFGLAQTPDTSPELKHTMMGTPQYMAPEIFSGEFPKYGEKSDVWALGVLLHEITALKTPFTAFDMKGLTNKICKAPPPPLPDKYSTEWRELVRSCLRKAPSERPTVAALLASPVLAGPLAKVEASFGPPTTAGATPVVITKHDAAAILEDCKTASKSSGGKGAPRPVSSRPKSSRLPAVPAAQRPTPARMAVARPEPKPRPISSRLPPVRKKGGVRAAQPQTAEAPAPQRKPRVPTVAKKAPPKAGGPAGTSAKIAELQAALGDGAEAARKPRVPVLSKRAAGEDAGTAGGAEAAPERKPAIANKSSDLKRQRVVIKLPAVEASEGSGYAHAPPRAKEAPTQGAGMGAAGKQRDQKERGVAGGAKSEGAAPKEGAPGEAGAAVKPAPGNQERGWAAEGGEGAKSSKVKRGKGVAAYAKTGKGGSSARRGSEPGALYTAQPVKKAGGDKRHGRSTVTSGKGMGKAASEKVQAGAEAEPAAAPPPEYKLGMMKAEAEYAKARLLQALTSDVHDFHRATFQVSVGGGKGGKEAMQPRSSRPAGRGRAGEAKSSLCKAPPGTETSSSSMVDAHGRKVSPTRAYSRKQEQNTSPHKPLKHQEAEKAGDKSPGGKMKGDFKLKGLFAEQPGARERGASPHKPRLTIGPKHFHSGASIDITSLLSPVSPLPGPFAPATASAKRALAKAKLPGGGAEGQGPYFGGRASPMGHAGDMLSANMRQLARSMDASEGDGGHCSPGKPGGRNRHHEDGSVQRLSAALAGLTAY